MTRRYYAIATVIDHLGQSQTVTGETVIEADKGPVFTGLYDAAGNPLFSYPETHPIGFDLGWERD